MGITELPRSGRPSSFREARPVVSGDGAGREGSRRGYWLIRDHGALCAFTLSLGHAKLLPVFSFEEEARLYLALGAQRDGLGVRESSAGEIISLLHGLCASVDGVALDPVPEIGGEVLLDLLSVGRREFVASLLSELAPPPSARTNLSPAR